MEIKVLDFSEYPGARYIRLGPYSGEAFRDQVLVPALKACEESGEDIYVNFDGAYGYGSSFLEEVFGGLIRLGYDHDRIRSMVDRSIYHGTEDIISEIKGYVEDAIRDTNGN